MVRVVAKPHRIWGLSVKIFISGGCKNGKSSHAQYLSKKMCEPHTPLYYLATMIPTDSEDEKRIKLHQHDREGWGFETIESGRDILAAIDKCDKSGTFLLDSVTALLANEMFASHGQIMPDAYKKVSNDLTHLLKRLNNVVIVSDFIYSDAFLYDKLTEAYRRGLAYIDRQMAVICDVVIEACTGNYIIHKGEEALKEISCELA